MNERIQQMIYNLNEKVGVHWTNEDKLKFAELIVEECRTVVSDVYRKTPLELCGPLLTADEEIAKHFYGVEE